MGFVKEKPIEADEGVLVSGCMRLGGKGRWPAFRAGAPGAGRRRVATLGGVHPRMAFKRYEDQRAEKRSTMGRGVGLKDILGAFNETAAELSDPEVANQRTLIVP
jgi:hypothetical protein